MERLIVCQGTAQLVTAVAALNHHITRSEIRESQQSHDHLLICGLSVETSQVDEFAYTIEQMAALLHSFTTITRLSDARLEQLINDARLSTTPRDIAASLRSATGFGDFDEVFTVRDWQACNVLVLSAYPDAIHVCYGDSVGVYLSKDCIAGKPSIRSRIGSFLHNLMAARSAFLRKPRVDISYLLLPDAFGKSIGNEVVCTDASTLRGLFSHLSPLLNANKLEALKKRIEGRVVWVLLGSNFSEQGLLTPQAEVAAYREWIADLCPPPGAVLLLKSHPRDNSRKQEMLERHLGSIFSDVLSLDNIGSAYLPVETLLLGVLPVVADLCCLTVSTACLGARFVVGSAVQIGFGDLIVAKYIEPARYRERIRHETDLRRICEC